MNSVYTFIPLAFLPLLPLASHASPSLEFTSQASGTISSSNGGDSWLSGESGRFSQKDGSDVFSKIESEMELHLSDNLSLRVQGRLNTESDGHQGDPLAITEAYLEYGIPMGERARLQVKAGTFLPSTSMENINPLWQSPYTLTWSSINSWIAEEIRLTGIDLSWMYDAGEYLHMNLGAAVFTGNDSAGTLLAWRGWSKGSRLSGIGESLPLPPLQSLRPDGIFGAQMTEGARPIGSDLDDDTGWLGHAGLSSKQLGFLQLSTYDNNGDRLLYTDEYSWRTRYHAIGYSSQPVRGFELAAEFMTGDTGMGPTTEPHVQLDFESWYVLLSHRVDRWRITGRYEKFSTTDKDKLKTSLNADPNDEDGSGLTLALLWEVNEKIQMGVEWSHLKVQREEDLITGAAGTRDGDLIQIEARLSF